MLDASLRERLHDPLDRLGAFLNACGVSPSAVTLGGLLIGIAACVAVTLDRWWVGLVLWLLNRLADGIDGPLARQRGATDFGGFVDIVSDFAIYGGLVVAIGVSRPDARVACLAVLLTYYLAGGSFLAFSSLATKRAHAGDERSLVFAAGLAEGTETIIAMVAILALPAYAVPLLWVWTAMVAVTVVQRIRDVRRLIGD